MRLNEIATLTTYIGGADQAFIVGNTDMRTAQKALQSERLINWVVINKDSFDGDYTADQRGSFSTLEQFIKYAKYSEISPKPAPTKLPSPKFATPEYAALYANAGRAKY